jgi:uncharacterized membrane protein
MNLEPWLRLGHILGAMVWVGGGLMLSFVGGRVRARNDARAIGEFGRMLGYIGVRVLVPAVVATLVFGVWLVLAAFGGDFSHLWVILGLALFVVAFGIGAIFLSRVGVQLQGLSDTSTAAESAALLDRWILGYRVVLVVLMLAVVDMVVKPGG